MSHRLSSATTAAEAARIICEAADALFKWDDFALDLYSAEHDEVFSLLNITTVEGRRVEIPSSPQPKTANALIRRVVKKGAEKLSPAQEKDYSASTMVAPIRKGERVIGLLLIQNHLPGAYTERDLETLQTLADQCGGALERLRAEQDLRESQQRFHDLFENSPDAIFVEDLDGNVLDVNMAACALHGVKREELVGRNALNNLIPPPVATKPGAIFKNWPAANYPGWKVKAKAPMAASCRWRSAPAALNTPASPPCCCTCAMSPNAAPRRPPCAAPKPCSGPCGKIPSTECG